MKIFHDEPPHCLQTSIYKHLTEVSVSLEYSCVAAGAADLPVHAAMKLTDSGSRWRACRSRVVDSTAEHAGLSVR